MIKIYIKRFSRRLKNLREEKQLTQEELAEQLGISRQSIISVEKGKCLPSLPLALRLSKIFDLNLEKIFLDAEDSFNDAINNNVINNGGEIMPPNLRPFLPFGMDSMFENEEQPFHRFRSVSFPAVNVKQNDKNVVVTADIPGIKDDDIEVEVGDTFVNISGERKDERSEEDEGYFHQEISYGSFSRRIPLPTEVNPDKVDASISNGLLKLVILKLEPSTPKVTKIKIKKGEK